ncbi:MAG: hypothetical protein JNL97_07060, partial [Verrucomicrobiales bacterium]|nr:hypothetical protein [Verrucomicrobiales bacterium]
MITCYSRHYHQASSLFGLPPRRVLGRESLPRFLRAYDHPAHPGNDVILYGSQVENVALNREQAGFVEAWNREYAFPRLKFGGFAEAMRAVIGDRSENALTRVRGDGGPYWEDGLAANARVTARAREYARRLVSAEKLATAASGWNPKYRVDRADLDAAWEAVRLIDEHTWHADCSVRDPGSEKARRQGEAKDARADELKRAAERVSLRAMSAIADAVPVGPGTLMVFNPLSWPRSGDAEVEIGRGQALVDLETGATLGMEVLREGRVYRTVRFEVPTVPAMGFRSLGLRPAVSEARVAPLPEPSVLETPHYRVLLDVGRGGIRSIVDRATRRELVDDRARFALGQWVYVTGGDELPNRLVQFGTASPIPSLTEHGAEGGRLVSATSNRWGVVARMESRSRGAPTVETEVALPWGRKEIRVTVRVTKEATLAKEAAYVAFPWAVVSPRFRYATQNGFVDPARDVLTGGCLEWFAVQDWLAVDGGGVSVWMSAVDAPLVTLGDIVRGTWPETFGTRPAAVFG